MSTSANERRLVEPLAPVLGADEVMELLGLSPPTLRRLVKDGHLLAHRLPGGRKWIFRADEVLESIGSWPSDDEEDDGAAAPLVDQLVHSSPAQPTIDVASIWCPAPPAVKVGEGHIEQCAEAWLDAAGRAGLQPTLVSPTRVGVAGAVYELRIGPREQVLVVDDEGDEV